MSIVTETKPSDTFDAYRLYLKLQTPLSLHSSGTQSLGFCMTLTLHGVSNRRVTQNGAIRPHLPWEAMTASMAKKLANNLDTHHLF